MLKIIIASGPVIVENNKVLLNKHGDDDFWKFCGGRAEDYEINLKETAEREVMEEMGLEIEILNEQPYFFYTEKEKDGEKISIVLAHFLAKRINEIVPGADIRGWDWLDLNNLDQENLAPNILPTLKHFGFIK
ncbi:MAG: NUDIX domain-containing protein [Candidatus Falkowbacteria bacterium]